MKIAVASQNRRTVTDHTGRCRRFYLYDIAQGETGDKSLLDLPMEQSLHATRGQTAHPLDAIDVLISGGLGEGLQRRLEAKGIQVVVTPESDPDTAVEKFLCGTLPLGTAEPRPEGHPCSCQHIS